jgi:hypothetical protein
MDYDDEFDHDFDELEASKGLAPSFPSPATDLPPTSSPLLASPPPTFGRTVAAFGSHPLLSPGAPFSPDDNTTESKHSDDPFLSIGFAPPPTVTPSSSIASSQPHGRAPTTVAASPIEDDYGADFDDFAVVPNNNNINTANEIHGVNVLSSPNSGLDSSSIIESSRSFMLAAHNAADLAAELDDEESTLVGKPVGLREFAPSSAFVERTLASKSVNGIEVGLLRQPRDTRDHDLSPPRSRATTPNDFSRNSASQRYMIASREAARRSSPAIALYDSISPDLSLAASVPIVVSPKFSPTSNVPSIRMKMEAHFAEKPRLPHEESLVGLINAAAEISNGNSGGATSLSSSLVNNNSRVGIAARTTRTNHNNQRIIVLSREKNLPPSVPKGAASPANRTLAGSGSAVASSAVMARRVAAARAEVTAEAEIRVNEAREKATASIVTKDKIIRSLTRRLEIALRTADVDSVKIREFDVHAARLVQLEAER